MSVQFCLHCKYLFDLSESERKKWMKETTRGAFVARVRVTENNKGASELQVKVTFHAHFYSLLLRCFFHSLCEHLFATCTCHSSSLVTALSHSHTHTLSHSTVLSLTQQSRVHEQGHKLEWLRPSRHVYRRMKFITRADQASIMPWRALWCKSERETLHDDSGRGRGRV